MYKTTILLLMVMLMSTVLGFNSYAAMTVTGVAGVDFVESESVTPPPTKPGGSVSGGSGGSDIRDGYLPGPDYITILDPEAPAGDVLGNLPETGRYTPMGRGMFLAGILIAILAAKETQNSRCASR